MGYEARDGHGLNRVIKRNECPDCGWFHGRVAPCECVVMPKLVLREYVAVDALIEAAGDTVTSGPVRRALDEVRCINP